MNEQLKALLNKVQPNAKFEAPDMMFRFRITSFLESTLTSNLGGGTRQVMSDIDVRVKWFLGLMAQAYPARIHEIERIVCNYVAMLPQREEV